jgi:DNA-binding Lrp family transcriptional regulator
MTSKKRKYGAISERTLTDSSNLVSEVFDRLIGKTANYPKVNKLAEISPSQPEEADAENTPPSEFPATPNITLVPQTTVARETTHPLQTLVAPQHKKVTQVTQTTVVAQEKSPKPQTTVVPETTQATQTTVALQTTLKGELRIPNSILDELLPTLDPYQQLVYLRLYRLSYGFKNSHCTVGLEKLSRTLNISHKSVQRAIEKLEERKLIKRTGAVFGGKQKGNIYEVTIPTTIAPKTTQATQTTVAPAPSVVGQPNTKRHDHDHDSIKKNHHQSARSESQEIGEFENWMMTKYESLTGNQWTKLDRSVLGDLGEAVQEIKRTDLDEMMLSIAQRASAPIGSFKFFAIALQNELAEKPFLSQKHLRERYAACAKELSRIFVGKRWESESEQMYEFKRIVLKQMLPWKDDLANETFAA